MNVIASLYSLGRDLRHAQRSLSRRPAFTFAAVLMLAIGSGASTAVFSVVDSVLLEPLPYPESDRLVAVWHSAPGAGLGGVGGQLYSSASMFFTYAEQNQTFEHIGVWGRGTVSVTGFAEPEQVRNVVVSDGVLDALGVPPLLGRPLSASDQEPGAPLTVMLSYDYWQRRFGGDRSVVGRTITIDSQPVEIIGVMPPGFRVVDTAADLIQPYRFDPSGLRLAPFDYFGVARLKPGVSIAEANADLARMLPIWLESWPAPPGQQQFFIEEWRIGPALRDLKQEVIGNVGNVLWVVMGTIAIVLLIACANVTNLLLVRAQARERELAVRAALGAGAWRIARVLLLETMTLALLGALAGLAVGHAALRILLTIAPSGLPRVDEIAIDATALVFALTVAVVAGLVLGLVPALKQARSRLAGALHTGARSSSGGRERRQIQNSLVVAQVALALVLLVTAGLMVRTFDALRDVEPGFTDAAELQTLRISIPTTFVPDPERATRMQHDIVDALAGIAGVESVAFTSGMPMDGFDSGFDVIYTDDQEDVPGTSPPPVRRFKHVSPGLFETAGTRLLAGRDFTWTDLYDFRPVVVVSENLARELWGTPAAALGKRIGGGAPEDWREVIGVVQDVHANGLDEPPPTIVYWPSLKVRTRFDGPGPVSATRAVTFVIRSALAGNADFVGQVQRAIWSVNASLPIASVRTMEEVQAASLARTSFTLVMLATAGAVALALGVVGLYSVISYAVGQRRREIAIRIAVGAQQRAVMKSFVRYGVGLAAIGVALGIVAAAAVTRLMESLLYDVKPVDLPTYGTIAIALTAVAAIASYLPARRASTVDPAEALAAE